MATCKIALEQLRQTYLFEAFNDEQLEKIVNYISYLPVPEEERAPSINWRNTDFN